MIHLDKKLGEKEKIIELITHSVDKSEYELECLFYDELQNSRNPSIKYTNFISLLTRYKYDSNFINKTDERLTISLSDNKYNNVRILIKGSGAIKNYCNNENLNLIRNSVEFEIKSSPKGINNRVQLKNYNFRFNLKEEKNFNNDVARINDILREIKDISKTYRYKKIFSFKKKSNDFQVDISIVKSSTQLDNKFLTVKEIIEQNKERDIEKPKDVKMSYYEWWDMVKDKPNELIKLRSYHNNYKNIKESCVFTNPASYEVEVEYIKNKHFMNPKFKTTSLRKDYIQGEFGNFFKEIGRILQCIQGSFYIMGNDEKYFVKNQFIKVVENSINEKMLQHNFKEDKKHSKISKQSIIKSKTQGGGGSDSEDNGNSEGGEGGKGSDNAYSLNADNEFNFEEKLIKPMSGGTKTINGNLINDDEDNSNVTNFESEGNGESEDDNEYYSSGGGANGNANGDGDGGDSDSEINYQSGGAKKIAELKYKISTLLKHRGVFFGPMIVDLSQNNSAPIDHLAMPDPRTNTNININYLVTDKTDGERNLLFFNENGKAYGIDRESNIKDFGITIPTLANTIVDGEYINNSHEDKKLNNFYIFDSYIYKGENVMIKPFLFSKKGGENGRYDTILNCIKAFTEGTSIIQLNSRLPFILYKKEYMLSNSSQTYEIAMEKGKKSLMSENCESILTKMNVKYGFLEVGHMFSYKTDGLVFHPNNLSVFQKHMDDFIESPFYPGRWNNNYKWKSQEHLTIDFRIKINKELGSSKPLYQYIGEKKYVKANLMTYINHNTKKDNKTDNNRLNFYLINSGKKLASLGEEINFFSTTPFIGHYNNEGVETNHMGEGLFEVDGNDNIKCNDGSFITDGVICECSYNKSKDVEYRWNPVRIRPDKTRPNAYVTANTTWMLIHEPITKEFLSNKDYKLINGKMIKLNNKTKSTTLTVNNEDDLRKKDFYSSSQQGELLTRPLNKFNNYIKEYLIKRALSGYTKPNVIDLAVGELGDLHKYINYGVNHLLGIDINEHNLNNPSEGAATRVMENIVKYSKFAEKLMLIHGTATKNIVNADCVYDSINKYYLDVLYGRAKGNTSKLRKMEGVGLDGYDVITCMYAIHYMFDTETSLDNFLRNVSENLLDQGYFIGTCLDGIEIVRALGEAKEIHGTIDGKSVYYIRKVNDDDNYKNVTVNNKINVYYETFATSFNENLVSISYLKEKAKHHNLKLIEFKGFLDEPGNMLSKYEGDGGKIGYENVKKIKGSKAMMQWAKFNSYFIFQKIRGNNE